MLLVTGPVSLHTKLSLERVYVRTPEPRRVIAIGACGCSCGLFIDGDNYFVAGPLDNNTILQQRYVDMAVEYMKKADGMEIYYDNKHNSIIKYERATEKFVAGNHRGEFASLFKRDPEDIDREPTRFIRLS